MKNLRILFMAAISIVMLSMNAQKVVTVHLKNGSVHQFPVENIRRIYHRPISNKTFTLYGNEYPMPTPVSDMSEEGVKWANMNIGAMNEDDAGLWFEPWHVNGVLQAVGDGWRLPTKEEIETLLHTTMTQTRDDSYYAMEENHHPYLCEYYIFSDYSNSILPIKDENIVIIQNYPNEERWGPDDWGFTFYSQLSLTDPTLYKFIFRKENPHRPLWAMDYHKTDSSTKASHLRLVKDGETEPVQYYFTIRLKDGTSQQFPVEDIESITHDNK